jgi:ABC-2 type transport system permease protein
MRKTLIIARREYLTNVRTKAFIISLVMMPVFMGGGIVAQRLLEGRVNKETQRLVVADETGKLLPALLNAAEERNKKEIIDPVTGRQVAPTLIVEAAGSNVLDDDARVDFSEQIRNRRIFAFAEIRNGVFDAPAAKPTDAPVKFHSESVVTNDLNRWFNRVINQKVHVERLRAEGLDPKIVDRATAPVRVDVLGLYAKSKSGEIKRADESSRKAAIFVPMGVMMLMFMSLIMSQTMLQNTLEEKQQKIAEVLLGSARPFELMMGKLIGNIGVSLTTVALYLAGGFWMLNHMGYGHLLRNELVAWFLIYQIMGLMIFGSIFVAIGASCNELKEAQNYLMPVMLLIVLPMMVWFKVLEEPMSQFSIWLSLFPPCTPMLMLLRMSVTQAIPLWQPIAGIVGTLAMSIVCVWLGGRIFRVGLLMQGKPPKLRELVRYAIRG